MRWGSSSESAGGTPLRLEETPEADRYLVTAQDVPPEAVLLEELPLVMLPGKQARRGRKASPSLFPFVTVRQCLCAPLRTIRQYVWPFPDNPSLHLFLIATAIRQCLCDHLTDHFVGGHEPHYGASVSASV